MESRRSSVARGSPVLEVWPIWLQCRLPANAPPSPGHTSQMSSPGQKQRTGMSDDHQYIQSQICFIFSKHNLRHVAINTNTNKCHINCNWYSSLFYLSSHASYFYWASLELTTAGSSFKTGLSCHNPFLEGRKETFYLTMHSTHIYSYKLKDHSDIETATEKPTATLSN